MAKILATPRSFAKADRTPLEMLETAGHEVCLNTAGIIYTKEKMLEAVKDAEGIIVGVDPLDREVIDAAPRLRAIAKYGVGTDNIDLEYCREKGIRVSITRGANSNAVADYAFALMLACARKLTLINDMCHEKNWKKTVSGDVYGAKLGILGLGAIGKGVARRAKGFDMTVLAYDVYWDEDFIAEHGIVKATPEQIFRECDFISLHMPLLDSTRDMIGADAFAMMKKGAVLINTARGELVDEDALIAALKDGTLAAAGIDAFREEPPVNEELYALPNLIMGSHTAASTAGASRMMGIMAAQNMIDDLK